MENNIDFGPQLPIKKEDVVSAFKDPEIKEKYPELEALYAEVKSGMKPVAFYECRLPFLDTMKAKYKLEDYTHSKLWHLLIGSQADSIVTKLDLPGGEIENFIRYEMPKFADRK